MTVERARVADGRDYGLNARVWAKFWAAERDGYVPPTPEERAAEAAARAEREANPGSPSTASTSSNWIRPRDRHVRLMGTEAYTGQTARRAKKQLALTLKRLRDGGLQRQALLGRRRGDGVEDDELEEESRSARVRGRPAARGETNIHDALELAFEDERVDTIYLLDGAPSTGPIVQADELRAEVALELGAGVVIHCIAVGQDHRLLKGWPRIRAENTFE